MADHGLDPDFADWLGERAAARFNRLDAATRLTKHHQFQAYKAGMVRDPNQTRLTELKISHGGGDNWRERLATHGTAAEKLDLHRIDTLNGVVKPKPSSKPITLPDTPTIRALPATERLRLHQQLTKWTDAGKVLDDCRAEAARHPGTSSTVDMIIDRSHHISAALATRESIRRANPVLNLSADA